MGESKLELRCLLNIEINIKFKCKVFKGGIPLQV